MIFRNLDSNSDWVFGYGTSDYVSGDIAIGLNIKTRILSWLNDCFFAMNAGIDWVNRLGSKNQQALLTADLKRMILSSYGVTGLTSFAMTFNATTREFNLNCAVNTFFSQAYQISLTQQGVVNA